MLIMEQQKHQREHIHIISSGENIHNTYHLAIGSGDKITRTHVIVEEDICKISKKDAQIRRERKEKIQDAIREVKSISEKVKIVYKTIKIESITLESVRDAVLEIYNEYPDAHFSFNISGGTKVLSIGLFVMSLWLNGEVYYTPSGTSFQKLAIPKMHVKELTKNPNYVEILKLLAPSGKGRDKNTGRVVTWKKLLTEMEKRYIPLRMEGEKKKKRVFGKGTLSKYLASLLEWNLIEEDFIPGSRKEKIYSIKPDGEFALKFTLIQQKKTHLSRSDEIVS